MIWYNMIIIISSREIEKHGEVLTDKKVLDAWKQF